MDGIQGIDQSVNGQWKYTRGSSGKLEMMMVILEAVGVVVLYNTTTHNDEQDLQAGVV